MANVVLVCTITNVAMEKFVEMDSAWHLHQLHRLVSHKVFLLNLHKILPIRLSGFHLLEAVVLTTRSVRTASVLMVIVILVVQTLNVLMGNYVSMENVWIQMRPDQRCLRLDSLNNHHSLLFRVQPQQVVYSTISVLQVFA